MKLKVKIIKCSEDDWYFPKINQIVEVKYYPFSPENFYQTVESSTFAPELIRIPDCEVIPEEEIIIPEMNPIDRVLILIGTMNKEDRANLFERLKFNYYPDFKN